MAESQTNRVLVVGGGITGSVLSLALAQRGVEVVLLEIRDDWAASDTASRCRATRSGRSTRSGVFDEIAERGFSFDKLRMRTADGHVIMEIDTPPMGGAEVPATMGALRSDVADVLAQAVVAAGVDVRLGTTVTAIDDHGDSVKATLSDDSVETFDLLVGADGIRSKVRAMIGIDDPAADRRHGHLAGGRAATRPWTARRSTTADRSTRRATPRSPRTSATPSCWRTTLTAPSSASTPTARCSRSTARDTAGSGARCATACRRRGGQLPVHRGDPGRRAVVPRALDRHR